MSSKDQVQNNELEPDPKSDKASIDINLQQKVGQSTGDIKGVQIGRAKVAIINFPTEAPKQILAAPYPAVSEYFIRPEILIKYVKKYLTDEKDGPVRAALLGMGGIGKTITAKQIGFELKDKFPGGIYWGSFAENSLEKILINWAFSCFPEFSQKSEPSLAIQVNHLLSHRRESILVIIDDIRQEWKEASRQLVDQVVPPGVPILITTRDRELAISLTAKIFSIKKLSLVDGTQLLNHYIYKDHPILKQKDAIARNLLDLTGGLPLAIMLAGKRIPCDFPCLDDDKPTADCIFAVREGILALCQEIEREKATSAALKVDADRELYPTFKVSFDPLSEDQKKLFRQMGIFQSSQILLDDLQGVMSLDETALKKDLRFLSRVSLINYEHNAQTISLHPLLHQYAGYEIEGEQATRLHEEAYGYFIKKESTPQLGTLLSALYHAVKAGLIKKAAAILLEHRLPDLLIRNGTKDLLIRISQQIFGKETKDLQFVEYLENLGYARLESPDVDITQRAICYRQLGKTAEVLDNLHQAWECYKRGEELLGTSNDRELIRLYREMAVVQSRVEEGIDISLENCKWALKKITEYSDEDRFVDEADLHISTGLLLGKKRKFREAFHHHKMAYRAFKSSGMDARACEVLDNLGDALRKHKKPSMGLNFCSKALEYYNDIGYKLGIAQTGLNVGACHYDLKNPYNAKDRYNDSLMVFKLIGERFGSMVSHINLGEILLEEPLFNPKEATKHLLEAYRLAKEIPNTEGENYAGKLLHKAYVATDQFVEAAKYVRYIEDSSSI